MNKMTNKIGKLSNAIFRPISMSLGCLIIENLRPNRNELKIERVCDHPHPRPIRLVPNKMALYRLPSAAVSSPRVSPAWKMNGISSPSSLLTAAEAEEWDENEGHAVNGETRNRRQKCEKGISLAGSRTPLSRVTGGCTNRYTTKDLDIYSTQITEPNLTLHSALIPASVPDFSPFVNLGTIVLCSVSLPRRIRLNKLVSPHNLEKWLSISDDGSHISNPNFSHIPRRCNHRWTIVSANVQRVLLWLRTSLYIFFHQQACKLLLVLEMK
jgi:hypothetical protein